MGHFWEVQLFGQVVHLNTLLMVWAAMAILVALGWLATRSLQVVPGKTQVVAEGCYDFVRSITMSTAGPRGDGYLFFIGSLFFFILTCNLMGQLPLKLIQIPHGELVAATGDINTTAALAVLTLVMYFGVGLKRKGLSYFKHYIQPHPLFLPINLLEDLTRPGSLMIRLYFNILVGEILSMIAMILSEPLAGLGLPVLVIFLELFVAVIQAYIFAILSAVYIGLLSEEHH